MRTLSLLFCLITAPLAAQDRQGRNTAGEWRIDHHKAFDLWDSMCDWRETDGVTEKRCYLRYVDVFAPKPKFAAVFTFITPEPEGYRVAFGFETGVAYKKNGLRVDTSDTIWTLADINCTRFGECIFLGEQAATLITALKTPNATLKQEFFDQFGREQSLAWDLAAFADALADFDRETASRDLR